MGDPRFLAAERRKRWAAKQRRENPDACRATRQRQDQTQRLRMIEFLGGECCYCGCRNPRSLVIAQPAGQEMSGHQLYSLVINDPDAARAELRLRCRSHPRERQPSESDEFGPGAARETWARSDVAGVAFG